MSESHATTVSPPVRITEKRQYTGHKFQTGVLKGFNIIRANSELQGSLPLYDHLKSYSALVLHSLSSTRGSLLSVENHMLYMYNSLHISWTVMCEEEKIFPNILLPEFFYSLKMLPALALKSPLMG